MTMHCTAYLANRIKQFKDNRKAFVFISTRPLCICLLSLTYTQNSFIQTLKLFIFTDFLHWTADTG